MMLKRSFASFTLAEALKKLLIDAFTAPMNSSLCSGATFQNRWVNNSIFMALFPTVKVGNFINLTPTDLFLKVHSIQSVNQRQFWGS